jgi:hypothetical protein
VQRYYCKICKKYQQVFYKYKAYAKDTDAKIVLYKKESCGMRGVARIMKISRNTIKARILKIARQLKKPIIVKGKEYEMDEMRTYIKNKDNRYWIAYTHAFEETGKKDDMFFKKHSDAGSMFKDIFLELGFGIIFLSATLLTAIRKLFLYHELC